MFGVPGGEPKRQALANRNSLLKSARRVSVSLYQILDDNSQKIIFHNLIIRPCEIFVDFHPRSGSLDDEEEAPG